MASRTFLLGILSCASVAFSATSILAVDHVTILREDATHHISGQIVTDAEDGGLLIMDRQGILWFAKPDEIVKRTSDQQEFVPLDTAGLKAMLAQELAGFEFHETAHYLICYNTSEAYARWCGALFERLYKAFHTYWSTRGIELHAPSQPLVALIFQGKASYSEYARDELGAATSAVYGYYSQKSNRVAMYDLTGIEGLRNVGDGARSTRHVNLILSQPAAERTVATIIHEATHQLAFNCGMHARYSHVPMWVSEGIAVYFETPDLKSSRGWRGIGAVNRVQLGEFRQYLKSRKSNSLTELLSSDRRFRQTETLRAAYAEAWALNYYLIRRYRDEYGEYLTTLARKKPGEKDSSEQRLADFTAAFGDDIERLELNFLRSIQQLK